MTRNCIEVELMAGKYNQEKNSGLANAADFVTKKQWLKWFCEAGRSPDEAWLEQTPYPFQPH